MNALAVFPHDKRIELIEQPDPTVEKGNHVKLQMLEVGVCGTDREIARFEYGTPPEGSDFLILGHESLARVVELGKLVKNLAEDDLVIVSVRRPCLNSSCLACRAGRQDFCYTGEYSERGIRKAHGFLAEYITEDRRYITRIPKQLRNVAILIEPLTIAEKALAQIYTIQERLPWGIRHDRSGHSQLGAQPGQKTHHAVVVGAGPIGLLGAMLLLLHHFQVTVYSREPQTDRRAQLISSAGARYVCSSNVSVDQLIKQTGNIDLVYEATGAAKIAFDLLKYLGTNGIFVFTGVPGTKAEVELDTSLLMKNLVLKNQLLLGTVNADIDDFQNAVRDLSHFVVRWPNAVEGLITSRSPLTSYQDVLLTSNPNRIKSVLTVAPQ
ncbi:MAG: glucose dehydrogenase [Acidobacteria bacterium]|nr:MAG: glucose dehydrogenase [Acidobacteriota bacterium]